LTTTLLFWLALVGLAFETKYALADWLFQTSWMSSGKRLPGWASAPPLLTHAGIHGVLTLVLVLAFVPSLWWIAAVDTVAHAFIDKSKAAVEVEMSRRIDNSALFARYQWRMLVFDQLAHHATYVVYIAVLTIYLAG